MSVRHVGTFDLFTLWTTYTKRCTWDFFSYHTVSVVIVSLVELSFPVSPKVPEILLSLKQYFHSFAPSFLFPTELYMSALSEVNSLRRRELLCGTNHNQFNNTTKIIFHVTSVICAILIHIKKRNKTGLCTLSPWNTGVTGLPEILSASFWLLYGDSICRNRYQKWQTFCSSGK